MTVPVLLALMCISACTAIAPLNLASDRSRVVAGSYIVVFKDGTTTETFNSFLSDLQQFHNVFLGHKYTKVFHGFSAKLNKDQLMLVRTHPQVSFVEEDQVVKKVQSKGWCNTQQKDADWGLARLSTRSIPGNDDYFYPSGKADGIDVYVIDTGIFIEHKDFGGRAEFGFVAESWWKEEDEDGHGTHVASTIGGTTYGVAKGVHLIAVKVLDGNGEGTTAGVISGVEYAIERKQKGGKPSIGNMSLGGGYSSAMNTAAKAATDAGVFMVVAAGNSNQDARNFSPASAANVICVGATQQGDESNPKDMRAYYSNWGPSVTLFAPGSSITAAWIGGTDETNTISGTSMASPHVAGVAALFLSADPDMSYTSLLDHVVSNATSGIIDFSDCRSSTCTKTANLMLFAGCEGN